MFINNLINKFGYSEMYEWSELFKYNIVPFGRFVTFADNEIGKIKLANENDFIIGVTTINSAYTSDDPEEWQGKYLSNEYGGECHCPLCQEAFRNWLKEKSVLCRIFKEEY